MNLEHSYFRLPQLFHSAIQPTPVPAPSLVIFNRPLALQLGLNAEVLADEYGTQVFAGNLLPPGEAPIAQAYAGHQYGNFTALGDPTT